MLSILMRCEDEESMILMDQTLARRRIDRIDEFGLNKLSLALFQDYNIFTMSREYQSGKHVGYYACNLFYVYQL